MLRFAGSHKLRGNPQLPAETEACASVTSAFLQVYALRCVYRLNYLQGHAVFALRANICVTYQVMSILFEVESLRVENPRNVLQVCPESFHI